MLQQKQDEISFLQTKIKECERRIGLYECTDLIALAMLEFASNDEERHEKIASSEKNEVLSDQTSQLTRELQQYRREAERTLQSYAEELLPFVRKAMYAAGFKVVERKCFKVLFCNDFKDPEALGECYNPEEKILVHSTLKNKELLSVLAHELCHSQQESHTIDYYKEDGTLDIDAWNADPYEREACIIGKEVAKVYASADASAVENKKSIVSWFWRIFS